MKELSIVHRARAYRNRVAMRERSQVFDYEQLLNQSAMLASALLRDDEDVREARIAFLVPAGFEYAVIQWAIWRSGGVAVPLCLSATEPELEYTLTDSATSQVVSTRAQSARVAGLCEQLRISLLILEDLDPASEKTLPSVTPERRAMILYTSGTTSNPKGVVSTHANIQAQIETLVQAWEWQADDRIPLFLPLHHIHGIINVLSCALWVGATVEAYPSFEAGHILQRVAERAYTVFMAVPTIYVKLISAVKALPEGERAVVIGGFTAMRLMVSGSAALPASVHEEWTDLTGQKLLERYGMTEIGMGLSNPYHGERRPGSVGQPLPMVEVRLKAENGELITVEGEPGEIQVKGPGVFSEYWERPAVTAESFDQGWFRTGDMAVIEAGYYRIMGRLSVDIIKSGGYKLSALEIESVLLQHPGISECAVVGIPDDTWGEKVAAALVWSPGFAEAFDLATVKAWCKERLSHYKLPKEWLVLDLLPRNAMGKVTKPAVRALFD